MVRPDNRRPINQLALPDSAESRGRVPYADPIGEMIHVSAFERFGKSVGIDKGSVMSVFGSNMIYRPKNLIDVTPYVAATYLRHHRVNPAWIAVVKPVFTWKEIAIIDWNGRPLDPQNAADVARVFKLLPGPDAIGLKHMPAAMVPILDPRITTWP